MNLNNIKARHFALHIFISFLPLIFCAHVTSSQQLTTKIIGGFNVSSIDGFRHQVSIRDASHESSMFGSGHLCGGSLIHAETVLTAAHCVHSGYQYLRPSYFVAVMGNLDLFVKDSNTVVRRIVKIIGHLRYDPDTFKNDIALLKLNSPVPENHPTVQPIPLARHEARQGQNCQSSGWGTTEYVEENSRAVRWLMAVNISVNARSQCNRLSSHAGSVIRGMFCAGPFEGGKDTCQGDSGGPFTCNGILVGVTSHGYECGLPDYPGIYMDVAYYKDWIAAANSAVSLKSIAVISVVLIILNLLNGQIFFEY